MNSSNNDDDILGNAWEQALRALGSEGVRRAELRVTVFKDPRAAEQAAALSSDPTAEALDDGRLPSQLRWLLTRASGTIEHVVHALETRSSEVDEEDREQLLDDVLDLEEELAALRLRLGGQPDWDADYRRLLGGEIPPAEDDD